MNNRWSLLAGSVVLIALVALLVVRIHERTRERVRQAEENGRAAAIAGVPPEACPLPVDTWERQEWLRAYVETRINAHRESREK